MIDEVVMLRHGRTSYNLARRLQGQIDVPLDIVGQWQADQAGFELAQRYYWAKVGNIARNPQLLAQPGPDAAERSSIDEYRQAPASRRRLAVVASDLFRAQQTAHAFADLLGIPVELDPRLRERRFGQWEGLTREEIRAMDEAAYVSWRRHEGGELAYGVESRRDVGRRGAETMREIVADPRYAGEPTTLVVVGHGSWIAATIETLIGLDPDGNALGGIRNASWSRLSVVGAMGGVPLDEPVWQLDEFNRSPMIAQYADWENGPADLRGPGMPGWKPIAM
ncbi:histidine phosphatase family protein [Bifidobacterium biavatii]|uniref:Phosphoglycerate mutase family protein n=1 Tax=Bifidobacterium biavatii DSM 23969 TaxID=1437608 RepID=A0A086ZF88_9BIFI|nr:histidine phosphatase family protein [Bifidobacterium biavatii]KFI45188.1 Phosphoglycerate mutase family protein [Bifidobacterium biavatii DSM 23969]